MAAESVGLAASIAGLVSLGLQITGGIASYLDALESRKDELASVRRHNNALAAALDTIKVATSHNSFQGQQHASAIEKNTQCCMAELQAVEELLAALADCNTTTWRQRLKNKQRKLTYSFDRPKVQRIVQRLQSANGILQLTLAGLGLDISTSHGESLATIEAGSRNHTFELLLLRSEVTTALTPVYEIRDQMPHFERKLDSTANLILSQSKATRAQLRESDRVAQEDVRRSHDLLQVTIERQLERLQAIERLQRDTLLASRAASKPAALRELCDTITGARHAPRQNRFSNGSYRQSQASSSSTTWSPQFDSVMGRIRCTCTRPYRSTMAQGARLGHFRLSKKSETQGHWPACPLSNTTNTSRRSVGFGYSGFASVLHTAVEFSFAMTSGAGGFSISPNFTYYATVDARSDPAFRTMELLTSCTLFYKGSIDPFAIACFKNLVRLFDDKKSCPAAVTRRNQSLFHSLAKALAYELEPIDRGPRDMQVFSHVARMLRGFGVPEFTYNSLSATDLLVLGDYDRERVKDAIGILLQANLDHQSPVLATSSTLSQGSGEEHLHVTFGILDLYEICPEYAEVSEVDIHGHTVLHLAATKPRILPILLEAADLSLLDKANKYGNMALTVAMHYTGRQCIHGASSKRCKRCGCTRCVDILLKAGCNTRTRSDGDDHDLTKLFRLASELARRRYVVHMSATRISRVRLHSTPQSLLQSDLLTSDCIDMKHDCCQLRGSQPSHVYTDGVEGEDDWMYHEIHDTGLADLLYRYGFHPSPSFFYHVRTLNDCGSCEISYVRWLVEHGADMFFRLPIQPPDVHGDSDIGLYAAHIVGFILGKDDFIFNGSDRFGALTLNVAQKSLKDGCDCHCSIGQCDPFIWMLKGMMPNRFQGERHIDSMRSHMEYLYTRCDITLTLLTYKAAIRYATFEALELTHTCCNPDSVLQTLDGCQSARDRKPWLESDEIVTINQEQTSLLQLHGQLVEELLEAALRFLMTDSGDGSLFPDFWSQCWIPRVEEELDKLSGSSLTEAEIRGAEEIGVRWCEPARAPVQKNPYDMSSLEHWFYELDLICPEYKEPWPEELCRVKELS
ncbi:hypothetical protein PG993_004151 [Apiospora rasikravindrae]|uniref:Fungal N-terminal domain-containing protein n=1 Tax=Apiospora rasikravindrae TaxID=990691 RepID=A0ABR1TBZ8_9PEZI